MLGGWARQGSVLLAERLSSHALLLNAAKLLGRFQFKRLFKDLSWKDNYLTIILEILFQNKGFFKILTQRSYLAIDSGNKV
jgi:hypothetical protein